MESTAKCFHGSRHGLRDRKQRVCLRGSSSSWCRMCSGVPQGSVLGPVLFLIFINDLDIGVSSDVLKFADDTKLFREVASKQDSICMKEDLNRLVEWAGIWQMQFNESKCKVMHLGSRNEKFFIYNEQPRSGGDYSRKGSGNPSFI